MDGEGCLVYEPLSRCDRAAYRRIRVQPKHSEHQITVAAASTDTVTAALDAIVATGRSDYPNQVNNVLCFPFIFRGALDVGATEINEEMKHACVHAIAALAVALKEAQSGRARKGNGERGPAGGRHSPDTLPHRRHTLQYLHGH